MPSQKDPTQQELGVRVGTLSWASFIRDPIIGLMIKLTHHRVLGSCCLGFACKGIFFDKGVCKTRARRADEDRTTDSGTVGARSGAVYAPPRRRGSSNRSAVVLHRECKPITFYASNNPTAFFQ